MPRNAGVALPIPVIIRLTGSRPTGNSGFDIITSQGSIQYAGIITKSSTVYSTCKDKSEKKDMGMQHHRHAAAMKKK